MFANISLYLVEKSFIDLIEKSFINWSSLKCKTIKCMWHFKRLVKGLGKLLVTVLALHTYYGHLIYTNDQAKP